MRLDYDLVRKIMTYVEETPPNQITKLDELDGDRDVILEHVELLDEHGLIEARIKKAPGSPRILAAFVVRLTWEGHEFLQNARNDRI